MYDKLTTVDRTKTKTRCDFRGRSQSDDHSAMRSLVLSQCTDLCTFIYTRSVRGYNGFNDSDIKSVMNLLEIGILEAMQMMQVCKMPPRHYVQIISELICCRHGLSIIL